MAVPSTRPKTSLTRPFKRALSLFREAARRVPAYKDFIAKAKVNPEHIETPEDFAQLPRTDKPSYMSQYSIAERSWDGTLSSARYISASSGSTGVPFFWPRGTKQDKAVGVVFKNIYRDIFSLREESTLFVNSFAFGAWIAGFEFYNAIKWVADHDIRTVIVTPGIDKLEAVRQIKELGPFFKHIVLAGYPPFVKDIIESGEQAGIAWDTLDVRLLVAGEAVSVVWKQKILGRIGKQNRYDSFVNVYGMAESGVVAHDTPLAQLVREHLDRLPAGTIETRDGLPVTGVYQYYPDMRYFEAEPNEALALTADAGLPLIRYDTRDTGGIMDRSITTMLDDSFVVEAKRLAIDLEKWKLPFVYLNGRKDFSLSFYALMIYVENIKYALENSSYASLLSGLFTMNVEGTKNLDQQFTITIELDGKQIPSGLAAILTKEIITKLCAVNSEYAKLLSSLGDRAKPRIVLLPRGEIQTIPGRKHKWVR